MKKRLAAIIFFAGTFLFTACIRKDSAADITNVEETVDNKVTISEQESEQTMAGMDLRYTVYLDDSHFYRDSVDVNWYGENGWIPIEISIEQWEVREEPDESKIAIRDRERFEKEKRLLINNSGKEAVLRYCYLDIAVENQGNMEYDFYPGSIRLVQRIPDDRYTIYLWSNSVCKTVFMGSAIVVLAGGQCEYVPFAGKWYAGIPVVFPDRHGNTGLVCISD